MSKTDVILLSGIILACIYPEMTRLLFMSEYFDVSLDYLMRGADSDESNNDLTVGYKAQNMLRV